MDFSRFHIGLMIGLLAAFVAPTASADGCTTTPAATACTYDGVYQSGCFTFALTYIDVWTAATDVYFNGYHGENCGTTYNGIAVGGSVGPVYTGVVWYNVESGSFRTCNTYVYYLAPVTGQGSVPIGCPAGNPPTPAWGNLLP